MQKLGVGGNAAGCKRSHAVRRWLLLAGGGCFLLISPIVCAQSAPKPKEKSESSSTGNIENGKKLFIKDGCYECHGREGQGAAQASGPRIGPPQHLIRPFIKYVRQPTGQMPPFTEDVVSDQQLADIYAYLQSRPPATPAKDIPLLNQ